MAVDSKIDLEQAIEYVQSEYIDTEIEPDPQLVAVVEAARRYKRGGEDGDYSNKG